MGSKFRARFAKLLLRRPAVDETGIEVLRQLERGPLNRNQMYTNSAALRKHSVKVTYEKVAELLRLALVEKSGSGSYSLTQAGRERLSSFRKEQWLPKINLTRVEQPPLASQQPSTNVGRVVGGTSSAITGAAVGPQPSVITGTVLRPPKAPLVVAYERGTVTGTILADRTVVVNGEAYRVDTGSIQASDIAGDAGPITGS